jgi:hypothetical protein
VRSSYSNNFKWMTQALMFLSMFIQVGKYHFYLMRERTLHYWTDKVKAKYSKSQKWEGKCGALKTHVSVGWLVKWNSLWCYTMLQSYNFIEWMISMRVSVHLWCHCNIVWIRRDLLIFSLKITKVNNLVSSWSVLFELLWDFHKYQNRYY